MLITELLSQNADKYGQDISLIEINPEIQETHETKWSEFELVVST